MGFSYTPLWKTLLDKKVTKKYLRDDMKISSATIAKMTKGEYVSMKVLEQLCIHFDCELHDIVVYEKENHTK